MTTDLIRLAHAAPDWTIPQDCHSYSAQEHAVWDRLFARQAEMLPARVVPAFINGLEMLRMTRPGIPDLVELNIRLNRATGWPVVALHADAGATLRFAFGD